MAPPPTLEDYLARHAAPAIGRAILGLSRALGDIAAQLAGRDDGAPREPGAGAAVAARIAEAGLRWLATTGGGVMETAADDGLAAAVDPIAGPCALPGTFFSLYAATAETAPDVRAEPVAAGCCLYGPRTRLALTVRQGTALFLHAPGDGGFRLAAPRMRLPDAGTEVSANVADYRHWQRPVRRYVDDCLSGADGPRERDFVLRWTGSLAAETHRILRHGGLFLAPHGTRNPPRLIHHCHPVALLIEQAGGDATDGTSRILDRPAPGLAVSEFDTGCPLVFGARAEVARVARYHDLPDSGASPLFVQRGLFRI